MKKIHGKICPSHYLYYFFFLGPTLQANHVSIINNLSLKDVNLPILDELVNDKLKYVG